VAGTDASLAQDAFSKGCDIMREGTITGMNGILLGIAKLKGMNGYALLGETSGYALDPKASEALLIMLEKLIGVSVDMKELEERAKEAESALQSVETLRRQQQGRAEPGESSEEESDRKRLGYIS
jgi:proteasome assembly chaperone (PAC2) family protein